jgi:hypothetical protein
MSTSENYSMEMMPVVAAIVKNTYNGKPLGREILFRGNIHQVKGFEEAVAVVQRLNPAFDQVGVVTMTKLKVLKPSHPHRPSPLQYQVMFRLHGYRDVNETYRSLMLSLASGWIVNNFWSVWHNHGRTFSVPNITWAYLGIES